MLHDESNNTSELLVILQTEENQLLQTLINKLFTLYTSLEYETCTNGCD